MNYSEALSAIQHCLSGLTSTGIAGFEGLTARLLELVTGQRFILSQSGRQFGQDARSESGYGNSIKVESKHYTKAKLDTRELIAELAEAASIGASVDLWVLATSARIGEQQVTELEQVAAKLEVETLLLDSGTGALPRFVILLVSFSSQVEEWLARNEVAADISQLRSAMAILASHPEIAQSYTTLQKLISSRLLGYDDARHRINRRFLEVVQNDGDTVARFGQHVALKSSQMPVIRRIGIEDQVSEWWNHCSPNSSRAVLVGEEGTGKTWAAFGWLANRIDAGIFPIVLPMAAATEVLSEGESAETILPRLLFKWTGTKDERWWKSRLEKWLTVTTVEGPLILLLLDGLSERSDIDWPLFLRSLEDHRWRTHVAVLASDRPGHWIPNCARKGVIGFREIAVGGYTDSELQQALERSNIRVVDLPQDLLPLISKPRYCDLVTKHYGEMVAENDFTVERLILIDARHRAQRKRGALSEEQFIEVIRNLVRSYLAKESLTLTDLQHLVPIPDPKRRIYEEIVDGGLLLKSDHIPPRYSIEPTRLVFGLGMLLAEEVRDSSHQSGATNVEGDLARWLEPHPEMDLKVRICGSAVFHSFLDEAFPADGRRTLLKYWLGLRNWDDNVQDAFIDYVARNPEDFIAVTEDVWSTERDQGPAQKFLANAFIKHRDNPRVQAKLMQAVERWMGMVHSAGYRILRHNEERALEISRKIAERIGHKLHPGSLEVCGTALTVIDDESLLRLKRLSFLIISAGTRSPFIPAIVNWAIAAAVMDAHTESDIANWVVRLGEFGIDERLQQERSRLLQLRSDIADDAADTLLWLYDPVSARKERERNPEKAGTMWRLLEAEYQRDPCTSLLPWTADDCTRCMERTDVRTGFILDRIEDLLLDPSFPVPLSLIERAHQMLSFDPAVYRSGLHSTIEDHLFSEALPLLASRASRLIADFLRLTIGTLPSRTFQQSYFILLKAHEWSLAFTPAELETLEDCARQLRAQLQIETEDGDRESAIAEAFALVGRAPWLTAECLFDEMISRPASAHDLVRLETWFGELPSNKKMEALSLLREAVDEKTLSRCLWMLSGQTITLDSEDRSRLLELSESPSESVRGCALRFIYFSHDRDLGHAVLNFLGEFRRHDRRFDALWAANVFCRYSENVPFGEAARKLELPDLSYALAERGLAEQEITMFSELLDACLTAIVQANEPSIHGLPRISFRVERNRSLNWLPEFEEEADTVLRFRDPLSTWGGSEPSTPPSQDLFDTEKRIVDLNRRRREQVDALLAAWGTEAFKWYGKQFEPAVLEQLCVQHPDVVRDWVEDALSDSAAGKRLFGRVNSLLIQLCPCLLSSEADHSLRLWRTLRTGRGPIIFDGVEAAFQAEDNSLSDQARWEALNACHDDAGLASIAFHALQAGREIWLLAAVQLLIQHETVWKRAIGLMLAAYSNLDKEAFDTLVTKSRLLNTWADVSAMRWIAQQNFLAQHWYDRFLTANDNDESWGALQMMFTCVDRRFSLWRNRFSENTPAFDHRLRFLDSVHEELEKAVEGKTKKQKETFLTLKLQTGEIFPFMNS